MKRMDEDRCKYLGVLKSNQLINKEMKTMFREEYIRRLKHVLKSKPNGGNMILAIHTWAV